MTTRQLREWQAFYEIEPWGSPADDARHGILCHTIAAPYTKPGSPTPPPESFMLRPEVSEENDTLAAFDKATSG